MIENRVIKKVALTLCLLIVYVIGRTIPLPFLIHNPAASTSLAPNSMVNIISLSSGGSAARPSLFILGLAPYMFALIFWEFFVLATRFEEEKFQKKEITRYQLTLVLMFAIVQVLYILSHLEVRSGSYALGLVHLPYQLLVAGVMLLGSFLVVALVRKNIDAGVGSMIVFILVGLVSSLMNGAIAFHLPSVASAPLAYLAGILIAVVILLLLVLIDQAELRIPLRKTAINDNFATHLYLPLRLNITGGMSLMFAFLVFGLPQLIMKLLAPLFSRYPFFAYLIKDWQLNRPLGLVGYFILVFLLTLGLAFVNVSPSKLVDNMRKNGDYLDHIVPGKPTLKVLRRYVVSLALFNACFLILFTAPTLVYASLHHMPSSIAMLPTILVILVSLSLNFSTEMRNELVRLQYRNHSKGFLVDRG